VKVEIKVVDFPNFYAPIVLPEEGLYTHLYFMPEDHFQFMFLTSKELTEIEYDEISDILAVMNDYKDEWESRFTDSNTLDIMYKEVENTEGNDEPMFAVKEFTFNNQRFNINYEGEENE
jgi:hypothetical protein